MSEWSVWLATLRHGTVGVVLAATLLAPPHALAAPPEYRITPCAGGFANVPHTVTCGMLVVEETRGRNSDRRVALPVAVVRALHPRAGSVPVIYLHGGPGSSVISGLPDLLRSPVGQELVGQEQDWIFLDQRGGSMSAPSLDCGPRLLLNDAGPLSDAAANTLIACGARHAAAGVNLSVYNALEVARDLQDLRQALRLEQFDLFGVSYGTRVAFSMLRTQPAGVRAVVLDSVWPPDAKWAEGGPKMIADAVHLLFARCASDRACHAAFPDPERDLGAFATRVLSGSAIVKGKTYTADDLGGFLMDTLYDAQGARSLPRDARAFAEGNFSALDAWTSSPITYVELQHLTHLCKEEFPFERRDHVADGIENDPVGLVSVNSFQRYFDVCAALPVGPPDPAESQPLASNVPTLFLSAEFDPGCPPALAQAAAARFKRAQLVQIPNTTHGVHRLSPCARRMIRAFLADPVGPVDRTCVSRSRERFDFVLK
jgi:pimeloyl-ACP methyl ester carboxylesterase